MAGGSVARAVRLLAAVCVLATLVTMGVGESASAARCITPRGGFYAGTFRSEGFAGSGSFQANVHVSGSSISGDFTLVTESISHHTYTGTLGCGTFEVHAGDMVLHGTMVDSRSFEGSYAVGFDRGVFAGSFLDSLDANDVAPRLLRSDPIRFCPESHGGCLPEGRPQMPKGRVSMVCWADASTNQYASNRWFWVEGQGRVVGYVNASLVWPQATVPHCDEVPAVAAANQALRRWGQTHATPTDQGLFPVSEWGTPAYEWSGDCVKLPYVGWYHATGGDVSLRRNDAAVNYRNYAADGVIDRGAVPVGGVAFWTGGTDGRGHEAIGIGNDWIVTTNGFDGDGLANTVRPRNTGLRGYQYRGFFMPR